MNDALDKFCSGSFGARRFSDAVADKFDRHVCEDGADRCDLSLRVGMGRINDVEDEVGMGGLFERRGEGRDELMRQVSDKAHGVRDRELAPVRSLGAPHRGVKGRE